MISSIPVNSLTLSEFATRLRAGIKLNIGPFVFSLRTDISAVADEIYNLYSEYVLLPQSTFSDFQIILRRPYNLRRWLYPKVDFYFDSIKPFKPLPLRQAYAMLEWGMNWCIANHAHHYLILHAAVLEKNGKTIIFPAPQGSGKSTLCAALAGKGWRLFSDELALISLKNGELHPSTRPINLKNSSIEIIKKFIPESINSRLHVDTHKGTVSLFKPSKDSVQYSQIAGQAHFVVFPKYEANSPTSIKKLADSRTLPMLIENSFNYDVLGTEGFTAMCDLVNKVDCYEFSYSDLNDAIATFDKLVIE
jgi:HprK-related kinase A